MRKSHFLLGTFLGGALILATGSVHAQSKDILNPIGNWTVSKLASASSTGQAYCAMARRHDQNAVLTFAQNAGDKSSLAVDFQKNILDRNKSYNVTLKAGDLETREQSLKPVSGSAFVIKLGNDPVFYDALKSSDVLTVSLDGKAHNFGLKDYALGQAELDACLSSIDSGQVKQAQQTRPQQVVENSRITKIPDSPTSYVDPGVVQSIKAENQRLKNALERERRQFEQRFMEEAGTSRTAELAEKVELLERQNRNLQNRLNSMGKVDQAQSIEEQDQELIALQSQNKALSEKISQLEQSLQQAETLNQQESQVQNITAGSENAVEGKKIAELASQLQSAKDGLRDRDARISRLKNELNLAKAASLSASGPADATGQGQLMQLKKELEQKDEEIWRLKSKMIASSAKGETPDMSVEQGQDAQALSDGERDALQQQISSLQRDLQMKDSQISKLEENLAGASSSQSTGNDQAVISLREEIQTLQSDNAALTVTLDKKSDEIEGLRTQLSSLDEKLRTKQQKTVDVDATVSEKEKQIQALQSDLAQTQSLIQTMDLEYQSRIQSYEERLRSQNLQIQAAEQERLNLTDGLKDDQEDLIQDLRMQISALEMEVRRFQSDQESSFDDDAAAAALESLSDYSNLQAELDSVLRERNTLAATVEEFEEKRREGLLAASGENWDLQKATSRFSEAERQIKRLGQKLDRSKKQCEVDIKELEFKLFDPTIANKEQTIRLVTLEKQLIDARNALTAQKQRYEEQIKALEGEVRVSRQMPAAPAVPVRTESTVNAESLQRQLDAAQALMRQNDSRYKQQISSLENQLRMAQTGANANNARMVPASVDRQAQSQSRQRVVPRQIAPASPPAPVDAASIQSSRQPATNFLSSSGFSKVLQAGGVNLSSPVKASLDSTRNIMEFSWRTGRVDGTAEQSAYSHGQYQNAMNSYIRKQKAQCGGDFAAVPVAEQSSGSLVVSSYDLACVKGSGGQTSSVVFYNTDDLFTVVSHRTELEYMDTAMDVRDGMASAILNGRIASR